MPFRVLRYLFFVVQINKIFYNETTMNLKKFNNNNNNSINHRVFFFKSSMIIIMSDN